MGTARNEALADPDAHPFAIDVDKYVSIVFDGRLGPARRARMWLLDADLRVVACFRFSQAARAWRAEHPVLGLGPTLLAGVWRRRAATVHHFSIEKGAEIGPGFLVMHRTGIFIGPVHIGENCVIHHNVTIGQRIAAGDHGIPRIGDDVWIGPGATITGDIRIGDGATISAGSVVSRSVPDRALVAGNPGRVIQTDYDNSAMLNYRVRRPAREPDAVDRAVAEYAALRDPAGDPELEAVKAAIFLEDAFDVVLSDAEIDLEVIGTPEGMRRVVEHAARRS
jgi:serine acetyltransferase